MATSFICSNKNVDGVSLGRMIFESWTARLCVDGVSLGRMIFESWTARLCVDGVSLGG